MHRRALLAFGAGTLATVAGCIDSASEESQDPTNATPTASSTPIDEAPFPPNCDDVDEVVWYEQVADPDSSLVLEPSTTSASLPSDEIAFTASNDTGRTFETNFYSWLLARWENGRWYRVAPTSLPQPLMTIEPGGSHEWSVTISNDGLDEPMPRSGGTETVSVDPIGAGTYAFAIDGWWSDQEETPAYEHQTVAAARFTIEGDQLTLDPSSAVTSHRREGDTVIVSATHPYGNDADSDVGGPATYVLTAGPDGVAGEGDAAPEPLVTEQVYRQWPLRDALAFAEDGVEQVRVRTSTASSPPFGVQSDTASAIEYEGRTYRVSAEER